MQPPETTEQDRNRRNSVEKQLIEKLPELIYAQKNNLRHTHTHTLSKKSRNFDYSHPARTTGPAQLSASIYTGINFRTKPAY